MFTVTGGAPWRKTHADRQRQARSLKFLTGDGSVKAKCSLETKGTHQKSPEPLTLDYSLPVPTQPSVPVNELYLCVVPLEVIRCWETTTFESVAK